MGVIFALRSNNWFSRMGRPLGLSTREKTTRYSWLSEPMRSVRTWESRNRSSHPHRYLKCDRWIFPGAIWWVPMSANIPIISIVVRQDMSNHRSLPLTLQGLLHREKGLVYLL